MGTLLETVSRWHLSESTYTKECANTPGFISMMRSSGATNERVYLDYENYRHITFKWHFKITKALVTLLESQDYMQVSTFVRGWGGTHPSRTDPCREVVVL